MADRPHSLERRIVIGARPETVFRYFTDTPRFAKWWGEGSTIEGRPGGEVLIRFPGGETTVRGRVLAIDPPRRIQFTYGYGPEHSPEDSLVTVVLEEAPDGGTRLHLRHDFSDAKLRDHHVQGWRHQLAVFAKIVSAEQHADAAERVDAFLRAFGHPDAATRRELLAGCAADSIEFRDAFSATVGMDDMLANLEAVQVFMPGVTLERAGAVRLSHDTAIADWVAVKSGGGEVGRGTNVYELAPDGRLKRVTGFWAAP
jgi:uncharacterized protein YndB with AHSA1/START domain